MATDIKQFGKGALPDIKDKRDYRLEVVAGAIALPAEFSVRNKIGSVKSQGKSLSCVGQSVAYLAEILNAFETNTSVELSARDIYSLIYQSQGGAYVRDAMKKICDSGVVEEKDAPSYENGQPPSEGFMRGRGEITEAAKENGMKYLGKSYLTWDLLDWEKYKQAIYQGNGAIAVLFGNNYCWRNAILEVPENGVNGWYHAVICTGWKTINGKEYIEFLNSWDNTWGENGYGYIPKDYVLAGYIPTAWTEIDLPNGTYNKWKHQLLLLKEMISVVLKLIGLKKQLKVVK